MLVLSFFLTLSDYFSKWVEAVATTSKEAHQVASALYKVCVIQYYVSVGNYTAYYCRFSCEWNCLVF